MTARLARAASGHRHLRWGREVLATLNAHIAINDLLDTAQRGALEIEAQALAGLLADLEAVVVPYRAFLDVAHTEIRAKQRVGNYLCDVAQQQADGQMRPYRAEIAKVLEGGFARIFSNLPLSRVLRVGHEKTSRLALDAASALEALPSSIPGAGALAARLEKVGMQLKGLVDERVNVIEPKRRPLKIEVEKKVMAIREGLAKMDARLREHFPEAFIESLYPELTKKGTAIADDEDEDDDDTAGPEDNTGGDAGGG